MRTNSGADFEARCLGGDIPGDFGTSTTAPTATTFTCDGKVYGIDQFVGHVVVTGTTYGVILTNSDTVLTVDQWYTPGDPATVAAVPVAGNYVILPGGQPAFWMALTTDAAAPAVIDTVLASELTGNGWDRTVTTYGHTSGSTTYTLTKTFTSSDATARTINKIGIFNAASGGIMVFETALPSPPTLVSGDSISLTETVQL